MNESQAYEILIKIIKKRHEHIIATSAEFVKILAGDNTQVKRNKAQELVRVINMLTPFLVESEVPEWVPKLENHLNSFAQATIDPSTMLDHFLPIWDEIRTQKWEASASGHEINFEAIFEEYRKKSRLPELLEKILGTLQQIHKSEEVDSKTVLVSIERLMSTLSSAKKGTYFSLRGAVAILTTFLKNYLWEELEKLPGLGSALTALRKTIDELDEEMQVVSSEVAIELNARVAAEFKGPKTMPEFSFLAYDSKGGTISNQKSTADSRIA